MALNLGQVGTKSINKEITRLEGEIDTKQDATLPTYTVAGVPSAAANARKLIYVSNGNAGSATVAVSNGTIWINLVTGTAISAE